MERPDTLEEAVAVERPDTLEEAEAVAVEEGVLLIDSPGVVVGVCI